MSGVKSPSLVVVTGAGSGIGRATALRFAHAGAAVVAADINEVAAKETASAGGSRTVAMACDVADRSAIEELASEVERELGPVDIVVNNAGVAVGGPFLKADLEDWDWIRSINLDGVAYGSHAFGARMVKRGHGHVVNIASGLGYIPSGRTTAYCTTKAAVIMLSSCLRAEWAPAGVGVSAICPGVVNTPILDAGRKRGVTSGEEAFFTRVFAHGRRPDVVAAAVERAAARNLALVPVGIESKLGYHAMRILPAALRTTLGRI